MRTNDKEYVAMSWLEEGKYYSDKKQDGTLIESFQDIPDLAHAADLIRNAL